MADTNGTTDEAKVEVKEEKVGDVNGGGDAKAEADNTVEETKPVEDKKPDLVKVTELTPEVRTKRIKRQIEYYFGDYNLPTDKFLRNAIKEKDGWVPLKTLLSFNRLAALTKDPETVVSALEGSQLIQISEDKTELRRNPDKPLPEESEARRKEVLSRSVYVKGFPLEEFTMDSALDFLDQFGQTDDVVMRFYQDKAEKTWKFKGSVFIKFPTKEAAQAFLDLEEVKFGDEPLIRMWQEEYIEMKRKERLDQKLLKRKHPEGQEPNKSVKRLKVEEEDSGLPKNATLHVTKCPEGLTREMLKEKMEGMGVTVAFIDFNKGDEQGWIRLHEQGTAAKVMAECEDGLLKLGEGLEVTLKPLEGEEEVTFLQTARQSISARRAKGNQQGRQRGGRGGRRGRGGRGGGHWRNKRKHGDSDEPEAKMAKTEDSGDDGD